MLPAVGRESFPETVAQSRRVHKPHPVGSTGKGRNRYYTCARGTSEMPQPAALTTEGAHSELWSKTRSKVPTFATQLAQKRFLRQASRQVRMTLSIGSRICSFRENLRGNASRRTSWRTCYSVDPDVVTTLSRRMRVLSHLSINPIASAVATSVARLLGS